MISNFKNDFHFTSKHLEQAIVLWVENFKDSKNFAKYFIKGYSSNHDYILTLDENNVVSMAYIIKKQLLIEKKLSTIYLIVGVATKATHMGNGLMKNTINLILEKYKGEPIFMQADHWEYYRNWNFLDVSNLYEYKIKHTEKQKIKIDLSLNWNAMNELSNNQGSIKYNLDTFKEYIEMFVIDGSKIASINGTFIVYQNNTVVDFAYQNIDTFLDLLTFCKIKILQSHSPIESQFLKLKQVKKFTKSINFFPNLIFNTLF